MLKLGGLVAIIATGMVYFYQYSVKHDIEVQAATILSTQIPLHQEIIKGAGFSPSEHGGTNEYYVYKPSNINSKTIYTNGTPTLNVDQLIVYLGNDTFYRTAIIAKVDTKSITLQTPLKSNISKGIKLFNFYNNVNHPTTSGYYAITDYTAINHLHVQGNHLILGDSWIDIKPGIVERLKQLYPQSTFTRAGYRGQTTSGVINQLQDVKNIYDFIWLLTGTNDLTHEVDPQDYILAIKKFKIKVHELGAYPIIFSPSASSAHLYPDRYNNSLEYTKLLSNIK